jgi:hypothetical protein
MISEDLNLEGLNDQKLVKASNTNKMTQYNHLGYVGKLDMHTKLFEIYFCKP